MHLLLQRGYEVHVIDNVERGRSGFAPGHWPHGPIMRTMEETWDLFRIGSRDNFAKRASFPGSQFPVEAIDALARSIVPRWLSTNPLQVDGLCAVLRKTGPAILICHSQGGEISSDAASRIPELVEGIIGIEPSSFRDEARSFRNIPLVFLKGDYLDRQERWIARNKEWDSIAAGINRIGGMARVVDTVSEVSPGGSHNLMMDRHNEECLDVALEALGKFLAESRTSLRTSEANNR